MTCLASCAVAIIMVTLNPSLWLIGLGLVITAALVDFGVLK
jgi:hypothetical protein